jgi:hypothetical protein
MERARVAHEEINGTAPGDVELADGANETEQGALTYVHDRALEALAAELLDEAYAEGLDWPAAADAFREAAGQRAIDTQSPFGLQLLRMVLFELHLVQEGNVGCRLGPQWEAPGRAYPMRIDEASPDTVQLWRACARLCRAPGAVARASDLLWELRDGRPGDHGRRAVQAYLDYVAGRELDYHAGTMLLRAWDVASRLKAWDQVAAAEVALLSAAEAAMSGDEYMPGVALPMLAALCAKPSAARARGGPPPPDPGVVDRLLETAFATYRADYLLEEIAVLLRDRAATPAQRSAVDRRLGDALLELAEPRSGLAKQHALMKAIDVARARGLPDVVAEGTRQLQGIRTDELELQRVSVTVPMPADYYERALRWATRGRSWRDGVTYFLMSEPPTGTVEDLRARAAEHASKGYIHRLLATVKLTREGLPMTTTQPDDEAADLAFQAQFAAWTRGDVLAEGLRRLAAHHGTPDPAELLQYLCHMGAADRALSQTLADALGLFWSGQFDAATHLIVPKIETALRLILRECDVAIYRTQVGRDQGGYAGLHELLAALEGVGFDPDWAYFLRWLLLGPHGRNLRNDVAHGLLAGAAPAEAALALRAASLVILLAGPSPAPDWDDEEDGRPLTSGATSIHARSRAHLEWLLGRPAPPHRPRQKRSIPRRFAAAVLAELASRADHLAWHMQGGDPPPPARPLQAGRSRGPVERR